MIVPTMKRVVRFCGWMNIKLANEVIYAILIFVFFSKKIKRTPLKKNSSVNASKKLMVPAPILEFQVTPIKY
jgi:uncharacterized membrane protein SirB2